MITRMLRTGLLSACLVLCCAGCGTTHPIVRTETVTVKVPVAQKVAPALTAHPDIPPLSGATNGALVDYVLVLRQLLRDAYDNLDAIATPDAEH